MEGVQGRSQLMGCLVVLSGPPDLERLRAALAAVVAETPLLRSRIVGGTRRIPAPPEAVLLTGDADAERAFADRRLDLAAEPPYGLFVNGRRLLLSVHHSVMDGMGAVLFFDRLAAHYAGEAPPPPPHRSRRYTDHFRRLSWRERFQALRGFARSLAPHRVPPAARFVSDAGPIRWHELELDPTLLKAHGASVNDALLATTAVALQRAWPQDLPVRVFMTTSLRSNEVDVANRSADFELTLPATSDFQAALAQVTAQTPAARDRVGAVIRIFRRAAASYVPPAVMVKAMDRLHARPENLASSLFFSNVGNLDGLPRDFGDLAVEAVGFLPPLLSPPGVAVLAATTRGRMLVTVCGRGDVAPLAHELEALLATRSRSPST
jgi:NRPS condensation-like uncharacterized protein